MTISTELPPFSDNIWFDDGSLRDVYFFQTTLADNQVILDYLHEQGAHFYGIHGPDETFCKLESPFSPSLQEIFLQEYPIVEARMLVGNVVQVNNHFFISEEIEFDIDPRTVLTEEAHQVVLIFFVGLAHRLNKSFCLTYENLPEEVLLQYDPDSSLWTRYRPEDD
jgi:hypothetical protein